MGLLDKALGGSETLSKNEGGTLRTGARVPAPTAPRGEVIGDLWYDTSILALKIWNGTAWVGVASGTAPVLDAGLELYQAGGTPFIDFHNTAVPDAQDYKTRLIMQTTGEMQMHVGMGYSFSWFPDGEFDAHHIGVNGDNDKNVGIKIVTGTSGTGLFFDNVLSDNKILLYDPDYRIGIRGGTMVFNTGDIFDFRRLDVRRLYVDASQVAVESNSLTLADRPFYLKAWNDNTHLIRWHGSFDGFQYSTWAEHRFYALGQADACAWINNNGIRGAGPGTGADWTLAQTRAEDDSNGSASWATHLPNFAASIMEHWRGDNGGHWRNNAGGWFLLHVDVDDTSLSDIKRDIQDLPKVRSKVKKLKPKTYKFKRPNDPTAHPIVARAKDQHERWLEEVKEGRWDPKAVALINRQWEDDNVGFLVEDMVEEFPEVVTFDREGNPQGIRYRHLAVILWRMNQEQEEDLDDLKKRVKALEKKEPNETR